MTIEATAEMLETGLHLGSIGLAVAGIATGNVPLAATGIVLEGLALLITAARRLSEENKSVTQMNTINPAKTHSNLFAKNHSPTIARQESVSMVQENIAFPSVRATAPVA